MRILFEKGKQREFVGRVLILLGCPSLRELINRGVDVSYSSLKNYYTERRLMSEELYDLLCKLSGVNKNDFHVKKVGDSWGQSKGGKISKRKRIE